MKMFILLSLLFSQLSFANCISDINSTKIQINWTAFKTPSKVGVKGSFSDYSIRANGSSLNNLEATIETSSVYTKNKERDAKIFTHFFKRMLGSSKIKATIRNWSTKTFDLEILMNKMTVLVPMSITMKGRDFSAKGIIDVFDFNLSKSLKSINYACKELHQGKTWNDVEIELAFILPTSCK